jgi:hypothetical protein
MPKLPVRHAQLVNIVRELVSKNQQLVLLGPTAQVEQLIRLSVKQELIHQQHPPQVQEPAPLVMQESIAAQKVWLQ